MCRKNIDKIKIRPHKVGPYLMYATKSISRVLSWTVIYLGRVLPLLLNATSKGYAEQTIYPTTVLLRTGFTRQICLHTYGELLPRLSILTENRRLFSVALSLRSPSAAVSRCSALWSPDFPRMIFFKIQPQLSNLLALLF